jgi:hypothetical protein
LVRFYGASHKHPNKTVTYRREGDGMQRANYLLKHFIFNHSRAFR